MMCGVQYLCISPLGAQFTKMAANGSEKAFCVERTRLSCWCLWNYKGCTYRASVRYCLWNYKGCTYRASVRYVTKTWSVVLLRKKYISSYLKCIVYDKLLKPRQSFLITLYIRIYLRCTDPSSSGSWRIKCVSCSLILKMKLVPPSLPRSSHVSSSFWFIL
jgi:hypothetical protein